MSDCPQSPDRLSESLATWGERPATKYELPRAGVERLRVFP